MLRIRITIAHTHTLAKSSRPRFRTFYGTTGGFVGSALKGSQAGGRICQHENWFPCKFPYLPMLPKYRQSADSAQSKLADIDESRTIVEKYEPWWEKCHQTGPWIDCWWARRWEGSGGGGSGRTKRRLLVFAKQLKSATSRRRLDISRWDLFDNLSLSNSETFNVKNNGPFQEYSVQFDNGDII